MLGLSITDGDGGPGDAVELFAVRAAAAGSPLTPGDMDRVAAVCRGLDGMALAIELTAARFPSLGLDGIEAGLADRMNLLAGGRRAVDRHRSLRSALDWSYTLLDPADQAVLRRLSVFAAPFTAAAAEVVCAGWPPAGGGAMAAALARLADQSLLVAVADGPGTRYRALETVRQYGAVQLDTEGEAVQAAARHLSWCLDAAAALGRPSRDDRAWRSAFDQLADELRAALRWAAGQGRAEAYQLAMALGGLTFTRGLPGESQHRYEQAASSRRTPARPPPRCAARARPRPGTSARRAPAAWPRPSGRPRGDRAGRHGPRPGRRDVQPHAGPDVRLPPQAAELVARARALADGSMAVEARVLAAEAFRGEDLDPVTAELAERAAVLARRAGDPLAESAALDEVTSIQLARGQLSDALGSALRRTGILAQLPVTAPAGLELSDAICMATECATAVGDLRIARDMAERVRDLPFYREEAHLATSRLIVVAVLAGDWDEAVALAGQFREGWERAGRPRAGNLTRGAYAAATVHGLRGDDDTRADWLDIVDALATPGRPMSQIHVDEFFDALLLLHRGRAEEAMRRLATRAGALPRLVQRDVAAVVRGAVGRGGRRRRASGGREPGSAARAWSHGTTPSPRPSSPGPGRWPGSATGWPRRPRCWRPPGAVISGPGRSSTIGGAERAAGRSRTGRDGRDRHGLASRMRLNGVWVARRTRLKPASRSTAPRRRWPACAPSRPRRDLLGQRPRRADHRGQTVEGPPDRVQVLLELVAGHRLHQQQRAVRRQGLADAPGRPNRVAHVVQAVEHGTPGRSRCRGVPGRTRSRTWSAGPRPPRPPPCARRRSRPRGCPRRGRSTARRPAP